MNGLKANSRRGAALVCAAAGVVLFQAFGNATHGYIATNSLFYWWGFQWVNPDSETEHAWLVLGLALFLFLRNLRRTPGESVPDDYRAAAAIVAALALHTLGFVAQQPRVSILALLLFTWGILAVIGGRRWSAASAFPLAFMIFAIPVNALDSIGFWLRMGVVGAGTHVAHLLGIGVIRNGTQILAPDGSYQYDVVAACSGIRSLVALTALSVCVGYLWFRSARLRISLFVLGIPLVFLGNVVRISSIIVAARIGGQGAGDRVHDVMGYGVFAIVIGGMIGIAEAAVRIFPSEAAGAETLGEGSRAHSGRALSPFALCAAVAALAASDAAFLRHRQQEPPVETTGVLLAKGGVNPVELPTFLDSGWMGSTIEPTAVERSILPPDTGYSRKLYVSQGGVSRQLLLSIVLSGRDRTSLHRPELCLVGQGWTIDGASTHRFSYPRRGDGGFEATVLRVHRQQERQPRAAPVPEIVVYWYVGGDRIVASQVERMLYDSWNRVVHGRADRWAYVLVKTDAADGADGALARIQEVLNSALPSFQQPL